MESGGLLFREREQAGPCCLRGRDAVQGGRVGGRHSGDERGQEQRQPEWRHLFPDGGEPRHLLSAQQADTRARRAELGFESVHCE